MSGQRDRRPGFLSVWGAGRGERERLIPFGPDARPSRTFTFDSLSSPSAPSLPPRFNNKSGVDCRLLWINFQGEEVAYTVITKGEVKTYSTFFNHLWIARDARSGARLLIEGAGAVVGRAKPYEALITEPGPLPYSEERFGLWPEAAKAQIRWAGGAKEARFLLWAGI